MHKELIKLRRDDGAATTELALVIGMACGGWRVEQLDHLHVGAVGRFERHALVGRVPVDAEADLCAAEHDGVNEREEADGEKEKSVWKGVVKRWEWSE